LIFVQPLDPTRSAAGAADGLIQNIDLYI